MGRYERATLAAVGLWLVLCLATMGYNGPQQVEAVHIISGQSALLGYGIPEGDLVRAGGSPVWAWVTAAGYAVGGLTGARTLALGLTAVALLATAQAARNLFGARAAFWAALSLAAGGPFLALSHLAVPEAPALAGVAVSFMALTELATRDHRGWLVPAAAAYVLAAASARPIALMGLPLLGALFALRPRRAVMDSAILGLAGLAAVAAFPQPLQASITPALPQVPAGATADATALAAWFERLYLLGAALPLAVVGWYVAGEKRGLAAVLLLSLALWPAYHVVRGDATGESIHLAFGLTLAAPLMGLALGSLWQYAVGKAAVAVTALGLVLVGSLQLAQLGRAWPDLRQPVAFLVEAVRPGDRLLVNDPWPFASELLAQGRIRSPWDVCDAARLSRGGTVIDLCDYDWFVEVEGPRRWPAGVTEAVRQCRTFQPAYTVTRMAISLSPELSFVYRPVRITIWRNAARAR